MRKSCLVFFAEESDVSLKELRNMGIQMNEPLCFSVSKSFGKVPREKKKVLILIISYL